MVGAERSYGLPPAALYYCYYYDCSPHATLLLYGALPAALLLYYSTTLLLYNPTTPLLYCSTTLLLHYCYCRGSRRRSRPSSKARTAVRGQATRGRRRRATALYIVHCKVHCILHYILHHIVHYTVHYRVHDMVHCMVHYMVHCLVHHDVSHAGAHRAVRAGPGAACAAHLHVQDAVLAHRRRLQAWRAHGLHRPRQGYVRRLST